jgi:hypothetical protein
MDRLWDWIKIKLGISTKNLSTEQNNCQNCHQQSISVKGKNTGYIAGRDINLKADNKIED